MLTQLTHPLWQMAKLPASQQVHDFGYVLDPAYHGRGVMTEVVAVMIDSWVKPWMGIGKVGAVSAARAT
jgi:RimJ/RimL family protein N-acetyltransferase